MVCPATSAPALSCNVPFAVGMMTPQAVAQYCVDAATTAVAVTRPPELVTLPWNNPPFPAAANGISSVAANVDTAGNVKPIVRPLDDMREAKINLKSNAYLIVLLTVNSKPVTGILDVVVTD